MILIAHGFTIRQALMFNFFSGCTAFLGFFIGVAISSNETVRMWIFAISAGIFIYIALVDLVSCLFISIASLTFLLSSGHI